MTALVRPKCNLLSRVMAGGSRGAVGQAAGRARRLLALMALSVGRPVCCSFVEPLPSWPGLSRPSTPGRRKNKSRLGATGRKADGRKAFRACLRRCAGPSGMAGTSPAMTPRWRCPPPPPCSRFLPDNSQRDKSATFSCDYQKPRIEWSCRRTRRLEERRREKREKRVFAPDRRNPLKRTNSRKGFPLIPFRIPLPRFRFPLLGFPDSLLGFLQAWV